MKGDIRNIFEGLVTKQEPIIKTVNIDWKGNDNALWNAHAKGIVNIAKSYEPNFEVTECTKEALAYLLKYFTGAEDFTGDLNKGIYLVGTKGSGKTLLMKVFEEYTRNILKVNSFQNFSSLDIIASVNITGASFLEQFNHNFNGASVPSPITCYIDDVGSNNEIVNHFGSKFNAIEQLLTIRYNMYQRYRKITHISSNMYPIDLIGNPLNEEGESDKENGKPSTTVIYDSRVTERMREMFNIVELKQDSFRE